MAAFTTVDGDLIQVFVNGTLVANGTDCKISFKRANREVTTKDGGSYAQYEYTKGSWSVSGSYLHTDVSGSFSTNGLFSIYSNKTKVNLRIGSITSGQYYYTGQAVLDSLDMSGPQKANVTGSYNFTGDGSITAFLNP